MQLFSNFDKDIPSQKTEPGSYEWWYFDGISYDERYRFVIIFYEGNPFSSRYIKNIAKKRKGSEAMASSYPAISISVYENDKPVFYSLSEYPPEDCNFSLDKIELKIGENYLSAINDDGDITYTLSLVEELPSGDRLNADLTFKSEESGSGLFSKDNQGAAEGHMWNLVQPVANISGRIYIYEGSRIVHRIKMAGLGYHDHNLGYEPMKDEFIDWYWGRFHFDKGTIVYYVMNRKEGQQHKAWFIDPLNQKCLLEFDEIAISEPQLNRFLLTSRRRIEFRNSQAQVFIQQSQVLDSGPFYMRFASDAILHYDKSNSVDKSTGISEYIRPSRIHSRLFWPLVNMRRRHVGQKPHWVQKSPKLYRWTW